MSYPTYFSPNQIYPEVLVRQQLNNELDAYMGRQYGVDDLTQGFSRLTTNAPQQSNWGYGSTNASTSWNRPAIESSVNQNIHNMVDWRQRQAGKTRKHKTRKHKTRKHKTRKHKTKKHKTRKHKSRKH